MGTVLVAEALPELVGGIRPPRRARAVRASAARTLVVGPGEWSPRERRDDPTGHLGLLVLDGLLVRQMRLGGRDCVELLGGGDLLRPWAAVGEHASIALDARWLVREPARIAVLDRAFAARVAPYPEIAAHLLDRAVLRSQWLAFHLAVCHLAHVRTRLRVLLWHLADRWGRVTPQGVVVPLRLTHALLGGLVGARRPVTTAALGELAARGWVERRTDGSWLLHGDPPAELDEALAQAAGPPASAAA